MNKNINRTFLVASILLIAAFSNASASSRKSASALAHAQVQGKCTGGASFSGWYGMLVSGGGKYLSGAINFDGNCNVSGTNVTGGSGGAFTTTSVTGTYGQNSDGTFTVTLNFAGQSTPQTYMIGVSESGHKARGLESDGSLEAVIDLQSQLTNLTSGYGASSLNGTYAASCAGVNATEFNYVTFDGLGNFSGTDASDFNGAQSNSPYSGTYSVNGDGTFSGSVAGGNSYTFNGVIDSGVSEIQYTYNAPGTGGVLACTGKQSLTPTVTLASLSGWYGFVVGQAPPAGWGGKYLSGAIFFDGAGGLSGTNVNGGILGQNANTSVTGSYAVNGDNTISITMNLAGQSNPQTYLVGIAEAGNEALGIETDGTTLATIDIQSQLQTPTTPYTLASLNGNYAASCTGYEVDLNYTNFDGNGNIYASVDAYDDGGYGDNPYTGTYTVNADGTFTANFFGDIYNVFTLTGVIENGTGEIEFTYYQQGFSGVVACVGESNYGPVGTNPVATAPTFSPAPGAYGTAQGVMLSDTTPGAVIHYTTNGVTPTTLSPVYSTPIPVSASTTIQAIAVASGSNNSPIAAGTYFFGQSQSINFLEIQSPIPYAGTVTLNASATSGLPVSYTVVFGPATLNGNVLTITGAGSVTVQATQAGNGQYAPAAPVSQTFTVSQASTALALASNSNPSAQGKPVTFTATITPQFSGQATGTVTFMDGSTVLSTVPVSGNAASLATTALAAGTHLISAIYSGDSNFTGNNSAPVSQVVTQSTVSLVSSLNPSLSGKAVSFTATVSSAGTPTGTVKFFDGTTLLATVTLKSGIAKTTTAKLPAGSNAITAVYSGDSKNSSGTSAPLTQLVSAATTTTIGSSANPSVFTQNVTFTATINSSIGAPPDGETVTFEQGTTVLGTGVTLGGTATFSTSAFAVGTKPVKAFYGGDAGFGSSTSAPVSQVIQKAGTTVTLISSQPSSTFGQSVTFTATVAPQFSGTPAGAVVFKDGTTTLKSVTLSAGSASYTSTKLARGTHNITATYNGNASFTTSTGATTQTVN